MATVHDVRLRHEDELLALPGVIGVADAVKGGRAAIQVFIVEGISTDQRHVVPSTLDGYPVDIISTGNIEALN